MNIGEEFVCWITFKYQADAWDRFEKDATKAKEAVNKTEEAVKKTGDEINKAKHKTKNFMRVLQNTTATMMGFHSVVGLFSMLTKGFINATAQAREFEYALADIKKVRPELDTKQVRKELFEISKLAVGRDIITDIAPALKLSAQTFREPELVYGTLKLAEKMSRVYDTPATDAMDSLAVLYNNFLSNTNMSAQEKLDWLQDKGVQVAYSHHNYGKAQVKDILFALKRGAGVISKTNISTEYATSLITQLLNTGSTAERAGLFFRRLYTRLVKGVDSSTGQRITGMSEAFQKIGLDRQIFKNTMLQSGDDAFRVFFKALVDYHKKTGDAFSVMTPLVGQYPMEEAMKLLSAFEETDDLYAVLKRRKPMKNGKFLPKDYLEVPYETIMDTTEMAMKKAQTMKQQYQIKFGDQSLVIARGYYEAVAGLYKGLGDAIDEIQNKYTEEERKQIIQDMQTFGEAVGKVLGWIHQGIIYAVQALQEIMLLEEEAKDIYDNGFLDRLGRKSREADKKFYMANYNDYMLMKEGLRKKDYDLIEKMQDIENRSSWTRKIKGKDFLKDDDVLDLKEKYFDEQNALRIAEGKEKGKQSSLNNSPYGTQLKPFDNINYLQNTTNSNSNKNINVVINQENNFAEANRDTASFASQDILNILYSQLKSG